MSFSGTRTAADFNLEEFERRLRTAGALTSPADDPLFELARLVEASKPELSRNSSGETGEGVESRSFGEGALRPALEEAEIHSETDDAETDSQTAGYVERDARAHDWTLPPRKRRSFGWTLRVSALAIAGVAMVGAVAAIRGKVPGLPRQAPYIAAAQGPVKVAPPNDNTISASNDVGASLLKDTPQPAPVKVVTSQEQPIDLNALAASTPSAPAQTASVELSAGNAIKTTFDAPIVAAPPAPPPPPSQFPDPKPVRTVSLRPDGTPILALAGGGAESGNSASSILPHSAPANVAPKPPTDAAPIAQSSTPRLDLPTKLSGKSSARVAAAKTDTTAPGSIVEASNQPHPLGTSAKPEKVAKSATPQVAAAEPAAPNATDQTLDLAATKTGGWAVQLAAPKSESEAKTAMERLNTKYASTLKGSSIGMHKATVRGETIYRLRVVGLTKADAAALCARLKGDGADCFIAK